MRHRMRWIAAGLAALLGSALIGTAGAAGTAAPLRGYSLVGGRDLVGKTVTLYGRDYQVTMSTAILDEHGKRIGLADLRVPQHIGAAIDPKTADAAYYEARQGALGPVLELLKLVESMPE